MTAAGLQPLYRLLNRARKMCESAETRALFFFPPTFVLPEDYALLDAELQVCRKHHCASMQETHSTRVYTRPMHEPYTHGLVDSARLYTRARVYYTHEPVCIIHTSLCV